jgi:DNA (cytosine-5)-methyltransferase 1
MSRPRLLDLFCGAGGASMGYHRAGFDVTGVDLYPQKHYPFAFIQADALAYLAAHGREYDAIAASPPCQQFTVLRRVGKRLYPDLVGPVRDLLFDMGKPWVIENVPGAPLVEPAVLCGTMFGLRVYRHRLFEASFVITTPAHGRHSARFPRAGRGASADGWISVAGHIGDVAAARRAMGIDWMNRDELSQAIPPDYTEFIGRQLIERL